MPEPSSSAREDRSDPVAEVARLTEINRQLCRDFNGMLIHNARLSRELEDLGRAPGWTISTADLLAVVPIRDLLAEVERRIPDDRSGSD